MAAAIVDTTPEDQEPMLQPGDHNNSTHSTTTSSTTKKSSSLVRRLALVVAGVVLCAGAALVMHSQGTLHHPSSRELRESATEAHATHQHYYQQYHGMAPHANMGAAHSAIHAAKHARRAKPPRPAPLAMESYRNHVRRSDPAPRP